MARKQRRNRSRKKAQPNQVSRRRPFDPEIHTMPEPIPQREYDPCPISGDPITDIFTAITDPRTGKPANFDSVVKKLTEQEQVREGERLAYLGRGTFGIVAMEKVEGKQRLIVKKRIPFEEGNGAPGWRRELSPGISRDYVPSPTPIHELYSRDEVNSFPRFDATGTTSSTR